MLSAFIVSPYWVFNPKLNLKSSIFLQIPSCKNIAPRIVVSQMQKSLCWENLKDPRAFYVLAFQDS